MGFIRRDKTYAKYYDEFVVLLGTGMRVSEFCGLNKKLHPDKPLPHITPHVFRHTFCTNMANAGMDIKSLQYVMGHSDVGVTLNVYTHASLDRAAEQMAKIIDFKETDMQGKKKKSG